MSGQPRLGAKAGGRDCGRLPGGGGLCCWAETQALQTPWAHPSPRWTVSSSGVGGRRRRPGRLSSRRAPAAPRHPRSWAILPIKAFSPGRDGRGAGVRQTRRRAAAAHSRGGARRAADASGAPRRSARAVGPARRHPAVADRPQGQQVRPPRRAPSGTVTKLLAEREPRASCSRVRERSRLPWFPRESMCVPRSVGAESHGGSLRERVSERLAGYGLSWVPVSGSLHDCPGRQGPETRTLCGLSASDHLEGHFAASMPPGRVTVGTSVTPVLWAPTALGTWGLAPGLLCSTGTRVGGWPGQILRLRPVPGWL